MDNVHHIINYLHHHPQWGGFITFFIAFIESVAVLGTIIPGSVTMTAVGALVGTGIFGVGPTILVATCGALTGDILSYALGKHFNDRIENYWPFTKYTKLLHLGEQFFKKHGAKSVIIGRFFGPVRSLVPLVAGILKMPWGRFILAATISAFSWAIVYLTPGIFLGALALELPPALAAKFVLYALAIIFVAWALVWLAHAFFQKTWRYTDEKIKKLWQWLLEHHGSSWLPLFLTNPREPDNHRQLTLLFLALFFAFLFSLLFCSVVTQNILTHLNQPLWHLLMSLHNVPTTRLMVTVTLLGPWKSVLPLACIITFGLLTRKYWWAAVHLLALAFITSGAIELFKLLADSPRPTGLAHSAASFSFPSGHTTLTVSIFGFIAVLIATELSGKWRRAPYWVVTAMTVMVGLSRLYLGAHWFTDVIGGLFLGLTLALLTTISYRRRFHQHLSAQFVSTVSIIAILVMWLSTIALLYSVTRNEFRPINPIQYISRNTWWHHTIENDRLLYRTNRLGKPLQAINVQWLGDLNKIKTFLLSHNWISHPAQFNTLKNTLQRLSHQSASKHLPLLPQLYDNSAPVLLMTKTINSKIIVLRLWKSNISIKHSKHPLWVGTINEQIPPHKWLSLHHHFPHFISTTNMLSTQLTGWEHKTTHISRKNQPDIMLPLKWDGKILLIQ